MEALGISGAWGLFKIVEYGHPELTVSATKIKITRKWPQSEGMAPGKGNTRNREMRGRILVRFKDQEVRTPRGVAP